MGTRAAIYIPTDDSTDWLEVFCHYDGYPSHMGPALANADPDQLAQHGTIRGLNDDGTIAPTQGGRTGPAERVAAPTLPDWADWAYILTANGWRTAPDAERAAALGAA